MPSGPMQSSAPGFHVPASPCPRPGHPEPPHTPGPNRGQPQPIFADPHSAVFPVSSAIFSANDGLGRSHWARACRWTPFRFSECSNTHATYPIAKRYPSSFSCPKAMFFRLDDVASPGTIPIPISIWIPFFSIFRCPTPRIQSPFAPLALEGLMTVETKSGRVGKIGAELQEERSEGCRRSSRNKTLAKTSGCGIRLICPFGLQDIQQNFSRSAAISYPGKALMPSYPVDVKVPSSRLDSALNPCCCAGTAG